MEWIHDALAQVGTWASDDAVSKGAAVVGGALLATLVGWWRRRGTPERLKVNVDAPKGQKVRIEVGE